VDGAIALGGDGTMLGAMRLTAGRPVPVAVLIPPELRQRAKELEEL
jgi:hypothetical protein